MPYPCRKQFSLSSKISRLWRSNSLSANNRSSSKYNWWTYSRAFLSINTFDARSLSSSSGILSLRYWNRHFKSSLLCLSKTLWVARLVSLSSESSASIGGESCRLDRLDLRGFLEAAQSPNLWGANSSPGGRACLIAGFSTADKTKYSTKLVKLLCTNQ